MKIQNLLLFAGAIVLSAHSVNAGEFKTRVVASGLNRPTGIVAGGDELYFTEIPNPGTPNAGNGVKRLDLCDWTVTTVNTGEPEPVNIAMDRHGQIYWTCRTAGVILTQDDDGETTPVLRGLSMPSGIAVDRWGRVFFTQIPTPGVPGTMGGSNNVAVLSRDGVNILNMGEPEPQDIAVSRKGELYWTCKTAGVILERDARGQVGVLLGGLNHPTGIALNRQGNRLYWTEVPTPGVSGANGGRNKVWELNLSNMKKTLVNAGDPEPTDITVDRDGRLYWTCTSAGVIVEARRDHRRY
jgi:DNA-binding beta-propeller fold protein YncE